MSSTKITQYDMDDSVFTGLAQESTSQEILSKVANGVTASVVKSVQRGEITITGKVTSGTATINEVNTSKAVVLFSGYSGSNSTDGNEIASDQEVKLELTDATTVTASRCSTDTSYGSGSKYVPYQVVEFY